MFNNKILALNILLYVIVVIDPINTEIKRSNLSPEKTLVSGIIKQYLVKNS